MEIQPNESRCKKYLTIKFLRENGGLTLDPHVDEVCGGGGRTDLSL